MKAPIALISLLTISTLALFFSQQGFDLSELQNVSQDAELYQKFTAWIQEHPQLSEMDILSRFPIWVENFKLVQKINQENKGFKLGMTKFAHLTNEEFRQTIGEYKKFEQTEEKQDQVQKQIYKNKKEENLPTKVDWIKKGVVGQVFNQGSCGGCWAFSATQALTSLNAINSGNFVQLSQQQLIDCDRNVINDGCHGGNQYYTFALYARNKGMESLEDYPLTSMTEPKEQKCQYEADKVVFRNKGVVGIKNGDVQGIKEALTRQPVSVGINASNIYFQLYMSGILDTTRCTDELTHAVAFVGYDEENVTPYWVGKNSWGTDWGENGYFRVAVQEGSGVCGCQVDVTYPTV
ncbi:hypothetical protein PPERSA_11119 [Pseudocohnilembus persalinus]|uniref:Papain family cysteine protease n=1 Tax=Pseudocohnilembus persalinus TaxID=266149 RepID=A0A0V0QZ82_PSEPJ|nr:hypothetical protein PPERSA_11119 [Pseudocohnilembus persalinus]|eukprot:KRX07570.1 hypothetical protein PPERSA_11119 [Pseudocohnilembus persalinus]